MQRRHNARRPFFQQGSSNDLHLRANLMRVTSHVHCSVYPQLSSPWRSFPVTIATSSTVNRLKQYVMASFYPTIKILWLVSSTSLLFCHCFPGPYIDVNAAKQKCTRQPIPLRHLIELHNMPCMARATECHNGYPSRFLAERVLI